MHYAISSKITKILSHGLHRSRYSSHYQYDSSLLPSLEKLKKHEQKSPLEGDF